jgi:hypothetical protein
MVDYDKDVISTALALSARLRARVPLSPAQVIREKITARHAYEDVNPLDPHAPRPYKNGELRLKSQRCIADKVHGGQCNLRTCNGAYCWIHLQKESGLRIRPSTIPGAGRGLFTTRPFMAGELVTHYTGDLADTPETRALVAPSHYVASVTHDRLVDAARTNTEPGRMINSPAASGRGTNCTWSVYPRGSNHIRITASEDIPTGTELFVGYGPQYWAATRRRAREAAVIKAVKPNSARKTGHCVHANVAKLQLDPEPKTVKEARASPEWKEWKDAIAKEQQSLRDYGVYVVVEPGELPSGARILTAKWVFKRKVDGNGVVKRHKARVVARGFTQVEGLHYDETTSNVMQLRSVRILLALANQLDSRSTSWTSPLPTSTPTSTRNST